MITKCEEHPALIVWKQVEEAMPSQRLTVKLLPLAAFTKDLRGIDQLRQAAKAGHD
jgi:hypothetical protein